MAYAQLARRRFARPDAFLIGPKLPADVCAAGKEMTFDTHDDGGAALRVTLDDGSHICVDLSPAAVTAIARAIRGETTRAVA